MEGFKRLRAHLGVINISRGAHRSFNLSILVSQDRDLVQSQWHVESQTLEEKRITAVHVVRF